MFFWGLCRQFRDTGRAKEKQPGGDRGGDEKTDLSSAIVTSRTILGSALINCLRHA